MKNLLLFLFTILWFPLFAQPDRTEYLLKHTERKPVEKYQADAKQQSRYFIKSAFSDESLQRENIYGKRVTRVDYVYSRFRESKTFNQAELDRKRLNQFFRYYPALTDNDIIEWNFYEQTGCNTLQECAGFFHGFIIYYEDRISREHTLREIDSIKTSLERVEKLIARYDSMRAYELVVRKLNCKYPYLFTDQNYMFKLIKANLGCKHKFKGTLKVKYEVDDRGRPTSVTLSGPAFKCGNELNNLLMKNLRWQSAIIYRKKYPFNVYGTITFPLNKNSLTFDKIELPKEVTERFKLDTTAGAPCVASVTDTIYTDPFPYTKLVTPVFKRNKDWAKDLIVVDVTGSMHPYSVELLTWLRLSIEDKPRLFVFFNDGNDKPDKEKVIGSTGGIYSVLTDDFQEVKAKLFEAMAAGGGGDLPENNFEALLEGVKQCPTCKEAVMLADNFAVPRDISLLKKYNGKLRVVLCGTQYGVNRVYLNMARRFNFTVHTMNSDVTNLSTMKEGETVEIDGFIFMLTKQGFQRIYAN